MPRVPKIDELQIARQGIDAPEFRATQGAHVQAVQGMDASRLRLQRTEDNSGMAPLRFDRAIQASDRPSRDLMQMGQAISSWGDLIREIGLRESEEADRARVQEGINRYMEQSLDAQQNKDYGWQTMTGANALGDKEKGDLATQRQNRLKSVREQLLQSLGNERQKEAFNHLADEEDARANQLIGQHVLRESEINKRNQLTAGIAIAGKMMQSDIAGQREAAFAKINEYVAQLAQLDGLSGEALQVKRQELASPHVSAVIAERIRASDREGAAMMLAEYEDYLTPHDKTELMASYKTMHEMQTAREAAQALYQSGEVDFTAAKIGDPWAVYNHGFVAEAYLAKLVDTESGGNNRARPRDKNGKLLSSAYGRAQFTNDTWKAFGRSARGQALRGNMSEVQWLEMRSDQNAAEQATLWYAEENKRVMDREGIPFNNLTAYLFHFGGAKGGRKLYQAHPDTPLEQVLDKGQINANRDLVARTKTAGALIQYFAKKMDVKPDATLPTGQPQTRQHYSNAQIKQLAQQYYPDNPDMQRTFIDTYTTGRDVAVEQQAQAHAAVVSEAVSRIWAGEKVSELPPALVAQLGGEDIIKLVKMENEADSAQEAWLKRESWGDYMRYSNPEQLAKMSREQVIALAPQLGRARTEQLAAKWESVSKSADGGRKRTTEEKAVIDSTVRKALGEDMYAEAKKDAGFLDAMEYRVQEKLNAFMPEVEAGRITREDMFATIESELRHEFTNPRVKGLIYDDEETLKPFPEIDIRRPFLPFAPQEYDFDDTSGYSLGETVDYLRW